MLSRQLIRQYATTTAKYRPLLLDILPSKRLMNKYLFDFDSPVSYHKCLTALQTIYDNIPTGEDNIKLPRKVKGNDLLTFQKILYEIRTQSHSSNKYLIQLEDQLIEKSAEMGNRDALTIISFKALNDTHNSEFDENDQKSALEFIEKLKELNHPLVFKMLGDYQFNKNDYNKAITNYGLFLKLDKDSLLASQVYTTLGVISFSQGRLKDSKLLFEKSVALAPVSKCAQAHFYLGLLNEVDPLLSRYHFELSSSTGFLESFKNLGFLELNYFKDLKKGEYWFGLGCEVGDFDCFIGMFDVSLKTKDYGKCWKIFNSFNDENKARFLEVRKTQLMDVQSKIEESQQPGSIQTASDSGDRWSV